MAYCTMNKLSVLITGIDQRESLCFLELNASGIELGMLLFDLQPFFRKGCRVNVLFKETEVALAKGLMGETSFSNSFPAAVTKIRAGSLLAEITLQCSAGEIVSIITAKAAERLGLQEKDDVTVLIKASQLSLELLHNEHSAKR
ncbi:TOBE domain protein [Pelodictyon phaeoclathratiforme BU-1]|uniref:TOBE domain protein n=2 Tax=Pelodictyon phaeoclathratiforme TaxID=34090 RepID=B4SCK3_PELPB|nr:TOBE domain protein [Pelodictyon phaeoclathratiforme BU-1]